MQAAPREPSWPTIDSSIQVLAGTDVDDVWDRFEVFEALHHTMQICNPMRSAELDEVIEASGIRDHSRVLDVACGYGELLLRAAENAEIVGTGIDLSPWMVTAAQRLAEQRTPHADLTWVLGEARDFTTHPAPEVCVCIGAEWVWHDFAGTARAVAERLGTGGVAVIGAARLHHAADQTTVRAERGHIETIDDMERALRATGLEPFHRVDPDDLGWDDYLGRTREAAVLWNQRHSGPRAEQWLVEQADWQAARERDRHIIGWSVWISRKTSQRGS